MAQYRSQASDSRGPAVRLCHASSFPWSSENDALSFAFGCGPSCLVNANTTFQGGQNH